MVSTRLKNTSQIGSSPQVRVKGKKSFKPPSIYIKYIVVIFVLHINIYIYNFISKAQPELYSILYIYSWSPTIVYKSYTTITFVFLGEDMSSTAEKDQLHEATKAVKFSPALSVDTGHHPPQPWCWGISGEAKACFGTFGVREMHGSEF